MRLSSIPLWSEQAARACAIALGFSIPISVALDNVLLALILVLWLISLNYRAKSAQISRNQVALAAIALFALLIIGLGYGTREPGDGLRYLGKYADLAFIPILVTLFNSENARRQAWYAFAAAMVATLVLSYLLWAGLMSQGELIGNDPLVAAVFKKYLTQNVLMAYAAFLFIYLGRSARFSALRYIWWALAVLAIANVALVIPGRTGQVILLTLMVYLAYSLWRWKGALLITSIIVILIVMGGINYRLSQTFNEWKAWRPGEITYTATGERLEFYHNSFNIALAHPLIGSGTGSFPKVYADHIKSNTMTITDNPHNEYLNIAIQTGVAGLLLLLYLFCCVWRAAALLPATFERHLARGLVITFVIGCMFNSLLMDHVEGLFFAWASGVLFSSLKFPQPTGAATA